MQQAANNEVQQEFFIHIIVVEAGKFDEQRYDFGIQFVFPIMTNNFELFKSGIQCFTEFQEEGFRVAVNRIAISKLIHAVRENLIFDCIIQTVYIFIIVIKSCPVCFRHAA